MLLTDDLIDAMTAKETNGVTFQKTLRQYMSECEGLGWGGEDIASAVAAAMGVYRTQAEERVQAAQEDERDSVRKSVNNVIGDVARNVREFTGEYTIKCKQKKPEYIYQAEPIQVKSESSEIVEDEDVEVEVSSPEAISEGCDAEVRKLVNKYSIEEVGGVLAEMIKEMKSESVPF